MNKLQFEFLQILNFKKVLKVYFNFLEREYSFVETKNLKLVYDFWLNDGVAFTNNKIVIVIVKDFREQSLVTIIYHIQPDLNVPIYNKDKYFTLESFLKQKGIINTNDYLFSFMDNYSIKECIELSAFLLKKHIDEILSS